MGQLEEMQEELERLKTSRAIEQNKMDVALATLETEYGVADLDAAAVEYKNITETIIPQLTAKRDAVLQQAEDILNGISQGVTQKPGGTEQPARNRNQGRGTPRRQPVGVRRGN